MKSKNILSGMVAVLVAMWLMTSACTASIGSTWTACARFRRGIPLYGKKLISRPSRLALALLLFKYRTRKVLAPCVAQSKFEKGRQAWQKSWATR